MTTDHSEEGAARDAPSRVESSGSDNHTGDGAHLDTGMTPAQTGSDRSEKHGDDETAANPPLPEEEAPPLPDEPLPDDGDDGWEAKWDSNACAWYFYNNKTGRSQWENPRVPEASTQIYGPYDRFADYHHLLMSF